MINFRFHLVSLTAVFLALAAGITIGATVVDQKSVDLLERQLRNVESRREQTVAENDQLRVENGRWREFADQLGTRPLSGRLADTPVLLVSTEGIDRDLLQQLRDAVVDAGATHRGTLWLTAKWRLTAEADQASLASVLASTGGRAETLRRDALERLARGWAPDGGGADLAALQERGFLAFDAPAGGGTVAEAFPPGTLVVLVSGASANARPAEVAVPLARAAAAQGVQLLAAEPSPPHEDATGGGPAPPRKSELTFVSRLRGDAGVRNHVSTVDHIDDYRARIAAVLALADLRQGRTGHYGFGAGAQRLLPGT